MALVKKGEMMTTINEMDARFAPIIDMASQRLSQQAGVSVQFTNVESFSEAERRNRLFRCTVADPRAGLPDSVILKQVVTENYQPDDAQAWDTARFFRDWAGAQFLSNLPGAPNHAPRFYGGDRALGFIMLEDLGQNQRSLVEPLLAGNAIDAENALLGYITRLGQFHADTIGKRAEYEAVLHRANPALHTAAANPQQPRQNIDKFCDTLTDLAITPPATLRTELHQLYDSIEAPGDFDAFVHNDLCPDNLFFVDHEVRLIDFEFATFGHALIDACYARMHWPSCWCCNRLPLPIVTKLETAYRTELMRGCPAAADDDRFAQALSAACGYSLLQSFPWQLTPALQADRQWGIASVRARVLARLATFIATATAFDELPVYRATASHLLETLQVRWPDVEPLPLYPAFR